MRSAFQIHLSDFVVDACWRSASSARTSSARKLRLQICRLSYFVFVEGLKSVNRNLNAKNICGLQIIRSCHIDAALSTSSIYVCSLLEVRHFFLRVRTEYSDVQRTYLGVAAACSISIIIVLPRRCKEMSRNTQTRLYQRAYRFGIYNRPFGQS